LEGNPEPDRWAAAADAAGQIADPWLVAYARWREGEAALELRGAKPRAAEVLAQSRATADALGAAPLVRELDALGRRARVDLTPTSPPASSPVLSEAQRFGLTTRELEVLALVTEGRTNRQIADELFITEKTAGHHVSNVLGKLSVASRVEAAAVAHRLGLLQESETQAVAADKGSARSGGAG
jgi:DNA-binding CsgD family transcriptional regulator